MKTKTRIAFHPFCLAAYSVIGVFVQNLDTLPVNQIDRPLFAVLLLTGLIYFVFSKLTKQADRTGYLTTLTILWILFFGHLYRFAAYFDWIRNIPYYRLILHILWTLIIGALATPFVWKHFSRKALLTRVLNITSVIVLIAPTLTILALMINNRKIETALNASQPSEEIKLQANAASPDIYYIILDGYGRQDILNEYYSYDNKGMIDYLRAKGFYVADQSQSNYMLTQLSLPSSLNMTYLDFLTPLMGRSQNRVPVNELIQHSRIRQLLKQSRYQFVTIASFALFNQIKDADVFISPVSHRVSEFEGLLLSTSVLDLTLEALNPDIYLVDYNTQRKFVNFSFQELPKITDLPGPKFVFVHIWAPHPPFVFDADGNPIQPNRPFFPGDANGFRGISDEYLLGYRGQIEYVNHQMINTIDKLLTATSGKAIIILQGDHGPGAYTDFLSVENTCLNERFSILNAYYFPDQSYGSLYPQITPVNTFRVILNAYFGTHLPLLPDRIYESLFLHPYQFIDVTGKTQQICHFK